MKPAVSLKNKIVQHRTFEPVRARCFTCVPCSAYTDIILLCGRSSLSQLSHDENTMRLPRILLLFRPMNEKCEKAGGGSAPARQHQHQPCIVQCASLAPRESEHNIRYQDPSSSPRLCMYLAACLSLHPSSASCRRGDC